MIDFIVLCGPPGSGKTVLSKNIAEKHNIVRFSFDEMRILHYEELVQPVLESMQAGDSVIIDACFALTSQRKQILNAVEQIVCKRKLIYLTTPLEECIRRNAGRNDPLPDFVVEDIYDILESPTVDEGWDEIILYPDTL